MLNQSIYSGAQSVRKGCQILLPQSFHIKTSLLFKRVSQFITNSCVFCIQYYQHQAPSDMIRNSETTGLKFLVATDIHLGHCQEHPQLGGDSYQAFAQVLAIAHQQNVDFLLLGGDLFDEVNPSQKCLFKCLNLLKSSVFGNRQLEIGVAGYTPNFISENLNIALPIFTIHGNHDYPSNDFGKLSVCDLLHASNYMNYFGKVFNSAHEDGNRIIIQPLLIMKNGLKGMLAIYGLGYIKDIKLHKFFMEGQVKFVEPDDLSNTKCIFILHQNRLKKAGGVGASFEHCIPTDKFPKWLDLVIWGHQHEAIPFIEVQSNIKIFQPGSTVITSFIEAEARPKQTVLIQMRDNQDLRISPVPLEKSYRPMYVRKYILKDLIKVKQEDRSMESIMPNSQIRDVKINFEEYFSNEIEQIIEQNHRYHPLKKPIIRLKIDYSQCQILRLIGLEHKFKDKVANPNNIFRYAQKRAPRKPVHSLDDKDIVQMVKNKTTVSTSSQKVQQRELTSEIMGLFEQQLKKTSLKFFDPRCLLDKVYQYSQVEGKIPLNDIISFYTSELDQKQKVAFKEISQFQKSQNWLAQKMEEQLIMVAQNNIGSSQKLQTADYQQINQQIQRYRQNFKMMEHRLGNRQFASKNKTQASVNSKEVKVESVMDENQRSGGGGSRKDNPIMLISSDEEDCCERASKQQYQEYKTRENFNKANQQIKRGKSKKKGATLKDFV